MQRLAFILAGHVEPVVVTVQQTSWPSRASRNARVRRLRGADSTGRPIRQRYRDRHERIARRELACTFTQHD
jgi:hypothetical protein